MVERTGMGDPVCVLPLLWRQGLRPGRRGLTLDVVLDASLALADEKGLESLTMRRLAEAVGVGTMTVYAHVPGRGELIDLMVDRVHGELRHDEPAETSSWRESLRAVADSNWRLFEAHPWLLDVDTSRPPLGPGTIKKYDQELRAFADTGLGDVEIDQALTLLLEHVKSSARQVRSRDVQTDDVSSDADWWESAAPLLSAFMDSSRYPHAARVGEAAGQEYGAAADPRAAYEFGIATILDGVAALVARNAASPASTDTR